MLAADNVGGIEVFADEKAFGVTKAAYIIMDKRKYMTDKTRLKLRNRCEAITAKGLRCMQNAYYRNFCTTHMKIEVGLGAR